MFVFGLVFILYFLKLSGTIGFWSNLRNTDKVVYKAVVIYQKRLRKLVKAKLDSEFLNSCKDNSVYSKFVIWKNAMYKSLRERNKLHLKNLKDAIKTRNNDIRKLEKDHKQAKETLKQTTTWMKYHLISYSVNKLQEKQTKVIKDRHLKKFDALLVNKCIQDGIHNNPNKLITNLTNTYLTDEEVSILNFGLKHGLLLLPKEPEMIAAMEDVWNQISRQDILKDNHISKSRVQTALRAFTYNYLDIESRDYQLDPKKFRVIRNLKEIFAILKPDKGRGMVLLSKDTYNNTVERIFKDKTKFKLLNHDPTLTNLKTIQSYLKTMLKRGEITEDEEKLMRQKFAHIGRAHGLPRTHKTLYHLFAQSLILPMHFIMKWESSWQIY